MLSIFPTLAVITASSRPLWDRCAAVNRVYHDRVPRKCGDIEHQIVDELRGEAAAPSVCAMFLRCAPVVCSREVSASEVRDNPTKLSGTMTKISPIRSEKSGSPAYRTASWATFQVGGSGSDILVSLGSAGVIIAPPLRGAPFSPRSRPANRREPQELLGPFVNPISHDETAVRSGCARKWLRPT